MAGWVLPDTLYILTRFAAPLHILHVLHGKPEKFEKKAGFCFFFILLLVENDFRELINDFVEEFPLQLNIEEMYQRRGRHFLLKFIDVGDAELVIFTDD